MKIIRLTSGVLCAAALVILAGTFACRPKVARPPTPPGGPAGWMFDNGNRNTVADHTGNVLLLNFYATWCGPCREEMPHLVALHQKYESQGLRIIGLNVGGEDDYAEVPAFKQEFRIPFALAIPDEEFVDRYLGINQNIPQSFVIDRHGRIVKHFVGFGEGSATEVETVVQAALRK